MYELLKLPSGDYVDPLLVTRIVMHEQEPHNPPPDGVYVTARVVVWLGNEPHIRCKDDSDALHVREYVGSAVNIARLAHGNRGFSDCA